MSISEQFKGLPMEDLIGAPLIAAANAQGKLANLTKNFIEEVGTDGNGKIRTIDFTYGKTYKKSPNSDDVEEVDKTLTVPLLAIINIPSLSVKKVIIDFEMEVKQQTQQKSKLAANTTLSVKSNFWSPVSASITGSVSTSKETTRKTDNSAKYSVHIEARDDGPPEGLAKVLNILSGLIREKDAEEKSTKDAKETITT
jgi:hypothetical protein